MSFQTDQNGLEASLLYRLCIPASRHTELGIWGNHSVVREEEFTVGSEGLVGFVPPGCEWCSAVLANCCVIANVRESVATLCAEHLHTRGTYQDRWSVGELVSFVLPANAQLRTLISTIANLSMIRFPAISLPIVLILSAFSILLAPLSTSLMSSSHAHFTHCYYYILLL